MLIALKQKELKRDYGIEKELSEIVKDIPNIQPSSLDLNADCIRIGEPSDINKELSDRLLSLLEEIHPWRKGPFEILIISLDDVFSRSAMAV